MSDTQLITGLSHAPSTADSRSSAAFMLKQLLRDAGNEYRAHTVHAGRFHYPENIVPRSLPASE